MEEQHRGVCVTNRVAVVLAAGEGSMQSSLPKVLHSVCGKTLLGMW